MQNRNTARRSPARNRGLGRCLLLGSVLAVTALGCVTPATVAPMAGETGSYRVGTPDQLFISILPDPAIERQVIVRPDGKVSVDLIGDVRAAGRTVSDIAREIEERIAKYKRDPKVTVAVMMARSTEVTVLGEVQRPATFPVERQTRLIEAIGRVGGPTHFAAKGRARVIRTNGEDTQVFRVDLSAIEKGDLRSNILLTDGDVIVVPPSGFAVVGYALQSVLFPFHQLLGFGAQAGATMMTGGASTLGAGLAR